MPYDSDGYWWDDYPVETFVSACMIVSGASLIACHSQHVKSGGTALDTIVSFHGSQIVSAIGKAFDTVVSSGGWQIVFSDGRAFGTIVSSGGSL